MLHEEYKEFLALDAFEALTPEESRALSEHLAVCDECRREAAELRETAAALAYTVAPVKPPEDLRERVLESVRASNTVLPFERPARGAEANGDGGKTPQPSTREARQSPPGTWRLLASRPQFAFSAIAAVFLITLLAALSVVLWSRNRELTAELARLTQSLNSARGELLLAREATVRANEIRDIVTSPDATFAVIAGTNEAPGASARIVVDKRTGRAVLAAQNLPPTPAGKAYQLWYITGGKPQPGGLFKTDAAGGAVLHDRVPEAGRDATLFAVTLEPEGGVEAPTGGMYLRGSAS